MISEVSSNHKKFLNNKKTISINNLPTEIILMILNNLKGFSFLNAIESSSLFFKVSKLSNDKKIQYLYRHVLFNAIQDNVTKSHFKDLISRDYINNQNLLNSYNEAVKQKRDDLMPFYFRLNFTKQFITSEKAIEWAIQKNSRKLINAILKVPHFNLAACNNALIQWACSQGNYEIVVDLLKNKDIDPSINNNYCLIQASEKGFFEIVIELLRDKRVDPTAQNYFSLEKAFYKYNNIQIMKEFLKDERVDPNFTNVIVFKASCRIGEVQKVKIYLKKTLTLENLKYGMKYAASNGHFEIVKLLLKNEKTNPFEVNSCWYSAFILAIKYSHFNIIKLISRKRSIPQEELNLGLNLAIINSNLEIFEWLIKNGADPAFDNNSPIILAASEGNIQIVEILLHEKNVDPSAKKNRAFITSLKKGHYGITKLLLNSCKIDPSIPSNQAISLAVKQNQWEIVSLLMKDDQVNNSLKNELIELAASKGYTKIIKELLKNNKISINKAFFKAVYYNQKKIVALLLESNRIDLDSLQDAFLAAVEKGNFEMVKLLLKNKRLLPNCVNCVENNAIIIASELGYEAIVNFLLKDERVDPSDQENEAIIYAAMRGHFEIVKMLLEDRRVNLGWNNCALRQAQYNGHIDIVKYIIEKTELFTKEEASQYISKTEWYYLRNLHANSLTISIEKNIDENAFNELIKEPYICYEDKKNGYKKAISLNRNDLIYILLDNGYIDRSLEKNYSIKWAVDNNFADIIEKLIEDKNVNLGAYDNLLLQWACQKGYLEFVLKLLKDKNVDPTAKNNAALILASENNNSLIVKELLKDNRVDPTVENYRALSISIQKDNKKLFKLLMTDPRLDFCCLEFSPLIYAVKCGLLNSLKAFLTKYPYIPQEIYEKAFETASTYGRIEILQLLHKLEKNFDFSKGMVAASKAGKVKTVKFLLKNDVDINYNEAFMIALSKGYEKIADLLLNSKKIDPSAYNNQAILLAALKGNTKIVKQLLKDERTHVAIVNACINACSNGHIEVIKLLLKINRIDIYHKAEEIIFTAVINNQPKIIEFFNDFVYFNSSLLQILPIAIKNGNVDIIAKLIKHYHFDEVYFFWNCLELGHDQVIDFLLKNNLIRSYPREDFNKALNIAVEKGYTNIVKILLKRENDLDLNANKYEIIKKASKKGHIDILMLLLKDQRTKISNGAAYQLLHRAKINSQTKETYF